MWWRIHHYLAIILSGIMLIWNGDAYYNFNTQFMYFSLYLGLIQVIQFRYQSRQMYKMRALGKAQSMDVNPDGVADKHGLTILIMLLLGAYVRCL